MTTALGNDTAFLHAHGIAVSPATLDKQLAAAVSQLQRPLYGESRDELPESELRVLQAGGLDLDLRKQEGADPLAQAAAKYAALLKTSLTTATVAARLGVDQRRIRQRLAEGTLYGLRRESQWLIPAFQFGVSARLRLWQKKEATQVKGGTIRPWERRRPRRSLGGAMRRLCVSVRYQFIVRNPIALSPLLSAVR